MILIDTFVSGIYPDEFCTLEATDDCTQYVVTEHPHDCSKDTPCKTFESFNDALRYCRAHYLH